MTPSPAPRHGGDLKALAAASGRDPSDIIDFSASLNPLGPPDWLRPVIGAAISDLVHYPDPDSLAFRQAAARRHGLTAETLLAGNGTSDLLFALCRAARDLGLTRALIPVPAYVDYRLAAERAGLAVTPLLLDPGRGFALSPDDLAAALGPASDSSGPAGMSGPSGAFDASGSSSPPGASNPSGSPGSSGPSGPSLVLFGRPNNPTGQETLSADAVRQLARSRPDCLFAADEAFADFTPGLDPLTRDRPPNVAVLLSLTKSFAIPGLRPGLLCADPDLLARTRDHLSPWSVNTLAQAVGERAMDETAHLEKTRVAVTEWRAALAGALAALPGLTVYPSKANFLLCRLPATGPDAEALAARLLSGHGLAIRPCANFEGLSRRHFRLAVRPPEDNARLLDALGAVLCPGRAPAAPKKRPTPALMFQGTASNAGKSVLAAALCRILYQDGWRVAPFKAQNMSLNSAVTPDGREIGRAQALQARACRLTPDARMNPILLKPTTDTGSQVIVLGRPVGHMNVAAYFAYKSTAREHVRQAYDALAAENEIMVLEGAGSPAEVNLKAHDIVNMAMAAHARAAVLLAADIDRGGAYAALLGSMDCLTEAERRLVKGFVLNRFRGDPGLLAPANDFLRRATGREVLGVIPYIDALGLPEEDSVSFKARPSAAPPDPGAFLDIAVLDTPRISNFTDRDAFGVEPDVALRLVRRPEELGTPDAVILPGSKSTLADLDDLRRRGLHTALLALAEAGRTEIVGLCAGLQMLGLRIDDPTGLESGRATAEGLGLLPLRTEFSPEKTLTSAAARHLPTGLPLYGYEIHHGRTSPAGPDQASAVPVVLRADGQAIGWSRPDGLVWGAYLHGLFDADAFRRAFLDRLRARRGLPPVTAVTPYDLEPALDRLADVARENLPMDRVYALLGLPPRT